MKGTDLSNLTSAFLPAVTAAAIESWQSVTLTRCLRLQDRPFTARSDAGET